MIKYNDETEIIKRLKLKIQSDVKEAVNEFLELLNEKGNPIIETINDEPNNSLVTICYYAEQLINNVLIMTTILPGITEENIKEHLLQPIGDTNLWYATYKVRNDIKFTYSLFPNDSLVIDCKERVKKMKADEKKQSQGEREKRELEFNCWMSEQIKLSPKLQLKFYMTVGILEHKKAMIKNALDVKDTLESLGYHVDFEFFKSGHDYLSWGEMLGKGLISLVG